MGSVKDLKIVKTPGKNAHGSAIFNFSDRYSVFDWGEMPDSIHDIWLGRRCLLAQAFKGSRAEKQIASRYWYSGNKKYYQK